MPIFELVHESANQSAAAVGRDSRIKMQNPMLAIGAIKRLRDRARKRLGTFSAKGRSDPRRPASTTLAKIFTFIDDVRTNDAKRRVEERTQRAQRIKVRECRHISKTLRAKPSLRDKPKAARS